MVVYVLPKILLLVKQVDTLQPKQRNKAVDYFTTAKNQQKRELKY